MYYKVGDENREPIMAIFRETSDFHMRMQMYKCGKIANTALNHFGEMWRKVEYLKSRCTMTLPFFVTVSCRLLSVQRDISLLEM